MNVSPDAIPTALRRCFVTAIVPMLLAACTATQRPPDEPAVTRGRTEPATPPVAVASPAMHEAEAPSGQWHVLGTEPFWSVRVDGASLLFATPENPEGRKLAARGERKDDAVEFHGDDRGKPFMLRLARGECSDGMSDRRYAFDAVLEIDGARYTGCAGEGLNPGPERGAD